MTTTEPRPLPAVLASSRELMLPALREAVDRLPGAIRTVAGYHLGWWDERGRPTRAPGGKAMRPALALLCAEAAGGTPESAVPAAVAVELVHNFSLLHDDVLDGDRTRRHRPAAWTVFGTTAAILTGDALLGLATDVLATSARPESTRLLTGAVLSLIEGEQTDIEFENRPDVDIAACVAMADLKTAALLAAACGLGARFAGAPSATVLRLRSFGRLLGLAFQHTDDLLGIWGDPAATGKPVHADLRSRKKSLPVVAALTSGTPEGRELAARYGSEAALTDGDAARVALLVEAAGGRAWSTGEARRLLAQALESLHGLESVAPRAIAELTAMASMIADRTG